MIILGKASCAEPGRGKRPTAPTTPHIGPSHARQVLYKLSNIPSPALSFIIKWRILDMGIVLSFHLSVDKVNLYL